MILEGIQKVEIINQGVDCEGILLTIGSVVVGAMLGYFFSKMMYNNQRTDDKYDKFVDEILKMHNEIFEIYRKVILSPIIYNKENPNQAEILAEEVNSLVVDLMKSYSIIKIKQTYIKKVRKTELNGYFANFIEMINLMKECVGNIPLDYYNGKMNMELFEERKKLKHKASEVSSVFEDVYKELAKKL